MVSAGGGAHRRPQLALGPRDESREMRLLHESRSRPSLAPPANQVGFLWRWPPVARALGLSPRFRLVLEGVAIGCSSSRAYAADCMVATMARGVLVPGRGGCRSVSSLRYKRSAYKRPGSVCRAGRRCSDGLRSEVTLRSPALVAAA